MTSAYQKNEKSGKNVGERKTVYDLYCSNEKGEKFIVEIQRVKQEFFKDRSIYYSSFAIQYFLTQNLNLTCPLNSDLVFPKISSPPEPIVSRSLKSKRA